MWSESEHSPQRQEPVWKRRGADRSLLDRNSDGTCERAGRNVDLGSCGARHGTASGTHTGLRRRTLAAGSIATAIATAATAAARRHCEQQDRGETHSAGEEMHDLHHCNQYVAVLRAARDLQATWIRRSESTRPSRP